MAIITTYVCDVSGVQGNKDDFVKVTITGERVSEPYYTKKSQDRIIHIDVARKLCLVKEKAVEEVPEPTVESKLLTLLKDYVSELAYEAGAEAARENRN